MANRISALKQENFYRALQGQKFYWDMSCIRYMIGLSKKYQTSLGGRKIVIEERMQPDFTSKWVVLMDDVWVLSKENKYEVEVIPSERTAEFIQLTRFSNKEQALKALVEHENSDHPADLYYIPNARKMSVIEIYAEEIIVFQTFNSWVNKASNYIGGLTKSGQKIICLDKNGKVCVNGADFEFAREKDLFPVTAYRLIKTNEELNG